MSRGRPFLVDSHAHALIHGTSAEDVLTDLEHLAATNLCRALSGDPLRFRLYHGELGSTAHINLIALIGRTAGHAVLLTRTTGETTEWVIDPDCRATVTAMHAVAVAYAPHSWRWTVDGDDQQPAALRRAVL